MRVKASARVSLNDVILALVGSALRSYLQANGELPERALIASVPSSSESEPSTQLSGNHVSSLFTTLATDVADDWQRLLVIHQVTQQAKQVQALVPASLLGDWLQYAMPKPASWVVDQWSRWQLADYVPPPVNVVVSFVRGPSELRFIEGRPLRAIYSVGPILEGIGLNITVWSYLDKLHFSVLACKDLTPDPQRISAGIAVALDNLVKVASLGRSPGSSRLPMTALSP
jgi:WS/DGAT/MGAT family acyltransferase